MYKGKTLDQLNQLSKMAVESSKLLSQQMGIFEETISETLRNAPDDQKIEIERLKGLTSKAINLAQQGKIQDVDELIKNFKNGR